MEKNKKKIGLHNSIPTYCALYITYRAVLSKKKKTNFLPNSGCYTLCYGETSLGHAKFFNFKLLSWTTEVTLCDSTM